MVLVLPWGKDEEATFGTGLEVLMPRLGEGVEAPRGEEDEREASVESGTHDGLLAFGDGRGDKDGTLLCLFQEKGNLFLDLFVGEAAGALHLQFSGVVEQELVANGCIGLPCDVDAEADTKEVGVLTFDEEAERVSVEIVNPPLEFAFARKDVVVVTTRPEVAVGAVVFGFLLSALLQQCCSIVDRLT